MASFPGDELGEIAERIIKANRTMAQFGCKLSCTPKLWNPRESRLDGCTHEVLAYRLSDNLRVDFVLDMVDAMCSKYGAELDNSTIVHSDQGCHYTSNAFIQKLKDASFVQSMSRKGNCWDNAPQESFFGHMKDEIAALIAGCDTYEQVQAVVADWMDYYNKDRYQWDLEKLSPREYYCYRQTGVYPLKPGISKKRNSQGSAPDPEV